MRGEWRGGVGGAFGGFQDGLCGCRTAGGGAEEKRRCSRFRIFTDKPSVMSGVATFGLWRMIARASNPNRKCRTGRSPAAVVAGRWAIVEVRLEHA